jgi:transcriptional regulator GlxA family with amidase domain
MSVSAKLVQAVFVIPPRVHLLDITGPAHVFYEATDYGAPLKLHFCNIHAQENSIQSSSSLFLSNLINYNELNLQPGDVIFVPGLESSLLMDDGFLTSSRAFQYWLKKQYDNGVKICSVCTGAFLLAEAGLLTNKECTTHWKFTDRFQNRFPQTLLKSNRLFVKADNIYTSAGVSSGIDLALFMLEELFGSGFATKIAKEIVVYIRRTESDPQISAFMQFRNHMDQRIHTVQDLLSQSLDKKLSITQLAAEVFMSPRNLTRLFRKTTQISIGDYLNKLRHERSVHMIADGYTMQAAAQSCGLKSTNQLRSIIKKQV